MMTPLIQVSVLLLASLMAPAVGAQQQQQQPQIQASQAQQPMPALQVQPVQVAMLPAQFAPTTNKMNTMTTTTTTTTTRPAVITKLEVGKPVIRVETPVKIVTKLNGSSSISAAPPKNRMKILKSADLQKAAVSKSADDSSKGFFSSLVDVDRNANKSRVGVHIPLIFDMTNDKDVSSGKSKLDLTVLSGLVTVNRDRENGKGPLTVTVFGIPVYTGTGNTLRDLSERFQSTFGEQSRKLSGQLENVASSKQLSDATMDMYSNVKRTGEKGIGVVTDSLDRVSSFLKDQAAPIANTNGRPATKSDIFVTRPPQLRPQDMKPSVSESAFKKFAAATNITAHDLHLQNLTI